MTGFGKRANALLAIGVLWGVVLMAYVFYHAVWAKERRLSESRILSARQGAVPAIRGRILDREGRPLCWSQLHFDAVVRGCQVSPARAARLVERAKTTFPGLKVKDIVPNAEVRKDLDPETVERALALARRFPELEIRHRETRYQVDYADARRLLGETETIDGVLVGVSGLEKTYDARLRGKAGAFEVNVDKNGDWIEGSWNLKRESRPGEDVRLDITIETLLKKESSYETGTSAGKDIR